MALILLGLTECSLCGKTLTEEDAIIGLPPLIDTSHPLYCYFDTGMHQSCYGNWDKKTRFKWLWKKKGIDDAIHL